MNIRALLVGLIALFAFVSCAPSDRPTVRPLLQGRYLGGASNSVVVFGANDLGAGGTKAIGDNIVSWSGTEVQVKIPEGTKAGGSFVFITVGGVLSNGLPYNVTQ